MNRKAGLDSKEQAGLVIVAVGVIVIIGLFTYNFYTGKLNFIFEVLPGFNRTSSSTTPESVNIIKYSILEDKAYYYTKDYFWSDVVEPDGFSHLGSMYVGLSSLGGAIKYHYFYGRDDILPANRMITVPPTNYRSYLLYVDKNLPNALPLFKSIGETRIEMTRGISEAEKGILFKNCQKPTLLGGISNGAGLGKGGEIAVSFKEIGGNYIGAVYLDQEGNLLSYCYPTQDTGGFDPFGIINVWKGSDPRVKINSNTFTIWEKDFVKQLTFLRDFTLLYPVALEYYTDGTDSAGNPIKVQNTGWYCAKKFGADIIFYLDKPEKSKNARCNWMSK